MAITTLEKAKAILQIKDTSKDSAIEMLIPMVEDWIQEKCVYTAGDTPVYPGGYELAAIRMIGFNLNPPGVSSESLGDYSASYATDYPKEILRGLKLKVVFK